MSVFCSPFLEEEKGYAMRPRVKMFQTAEL